ncbi:hypothetical protein KR222_000094 [Zaprionus bogoriensis]|nr:hypothetical protein KR222_000094 [Zaprionus bogoriensis]
MYPSFNELLQRAQHLAKDPKPPTDPLPSERTLHEVLQLTSEMHARLTQAWDEGGRMGANIMLGSHGVDMQKLTQKIENLNVGKLFQAPELPVVSVEELLKNEMESVIMSVIDETNSNTFNAVEQHKWSCTYADWEREKLQLLNAFEDSESSETAEGVLCPLKAGSEKESASHSKGSRLNRMQLAYAEKLIEYNRGDKSNLLVSRFTRLAHKQLKDAQVQQMWQLLEFMVRVLPATPDVDATPARRMTPEFLQQARVYLEQRFRLQIFETIQRGCHLSMLSVSPNVYDKVELYVRLTCHTPESRCSLVDMQHERPLWPHVYFSLRCGDLGAAMQFLRDWGNIYPDMQQLLQQQQLIKEQQLRLDQRLLKARLQMSLMPEYRVISGDPYKKAVFAMLLDYDQPQEQHCELVQSIDDFLWLHLSLRRDVSHLSLADLQSVMSCNCGPKFLSDKMTIPVYFQLLILTGHFEAAIEFLARSEAMRPHAVHMAIALDELQLLDTPRNELESLLSSDPGDLSPSSRLNLVRLVVAYAKPFELSNTEEALHYYYLLRKFTSSENGRSVMTNCIVELLVEAGDEKTLKFFFGTSQSFDPSITCGGFYLQLPDLVSEKHELAAIVATELAKRAKYKPAISMYILARKLNKALSLMSSLLAQVVHQQQGKSSLRDTLRHIISELNVALAGSHKQLQPDVLETYSLFTRLMDFFDAHHAGNLLLASKILNNCELVANNCGEVNERLIRLKFLGIDVHKVMPSVLLAAMSIVHSEYEQLKLQHTPEVHKLRAHLQERAKALINLAATSPYRIPQETNKQLVQLEIEMQY